MWVCGIGWGCFLKMCVYVGGWYWLGLFSLDVCICGWVVMVGAFFFRCEWVVLVGAVFC